MPYGTNYRFAVENGKVSAGRNRDDRQGYGLFREEILESHPWWWKLDTCSEADRVVQEPGRNRQELCDSGWL